MELVINTIITGRELLLNEEGNGELRDEILISQRNKDEKSNQFSLTMNSSNKL